MNEVSSMTVESAPDSSHPGRQLAAAREGCGYTVADIARQLKLSPRQVEAMEADDYEHLPGAVFVRGFIRNYARLVNLDPALLLGNAQQTPRVSAPKAHTPHSVDIPFPTRRELRWHRYAIGGLLLLAMFVIYEFYSGDAAETTVSSRPVALPQSEIEAANAAAEKIADVSAQVPGAALADSAADAAGAASATPLKVDAAGNPELSGGPASAGHTPGEHLLKLRFERESWVEIHDRHGRKIFSGLNSAGTDLAVSGLPPLSLVVGNAAGVRLTHNDQPVDLAPHIKIDVARLTLE